MNTKKTLLGSALVLYFIIAFEVLIMISPFAGFFYSVFNPVLLTLAGNSTTRWLSAFFLPHLVLPQDPFLQSVRIMGSILFVLGMTIFLICAGQIYTAKFRKRGAVLSGLYSRIRHPQYLALETAGLGLAVLWPRFLTIVLWLLMALVYYFLAKDEERRMLKAHAETYQAYMNRTGMFLLKGIEQTLVPSSRFGKALLFLVFTGVVIAGAFLLRAYTVHHLTLWTNAKNVTALAILPEDGFKMDHRMAGILEMKEVRERMQENKRYLVYFIPRDYVMQGMIADTGGDWKLFEQHRTIGMIADWVFNPFGHLRGGHHALHGMVPHDAGAVPGDGAVRRLIFISLEGAEVNTPSGRFSINALRVPQFMVDVDVHNLRLLDIQDLPHGSGWGAVPTPMF